MQFFLHKCSLRTQIVTTGLLEKFSVKLLQNIFFPSQLIPMGLCLHTSPGVYAKIHWKKKEFSQHGRIYAVLPARCSISDSPPAQPAQILAETSHPCAWGNLSPGEDWKLGWAETSATTMQWGRYKPFKLRRGATPACRQAQLRVESSAEQIHSLLLRGEGLYSEYLCIME